MSELSEAMERRGPYPIKGWSGTNSYVVNNHDPNQPNNGAFSIQAQFAITTYYTVQFTLRANLQFSSLLGGENFSPRGLAEIHWTVQGNHHQRILHVANGTTISGAGEMVWVSFVDATEFSEEEENTAQAVSAIISIVTGTRANAAGSQPPMYVETQAFVVGIPTDLPATLAAGVVLTIIVPNDYGVNAMLLTAYQDSPGAGLELLGNDITIAGGSIMTWGAIMCNKWVPVIPGVTLFEITNNTANNVHIGVIWGIEG
jgi:hypothetical protein